MLLTTTLLVAQIAAPAPIRLQADDAVRSANVTLATSRPSHTGSGYLRGFLGRGDRADWTFPSAGGHHRILIRYASPSGPKRFDLDVNGLGLSGSFPATGDTFAELDAGRVVLVPGTNRLGIFGGWHHYEIDRIELVPIPAPTPPVVPPPTLINPEASPEARQLIALLTSQYGKTTFSGVIAGDQAFVQEHTGQSPAVIAGDVMNYSSAAVTRNADTKRESERMIEARRAGHIITLLWHWYAPSGHYEGKRTNSRGEEYDAGWDRSFYTNATSFDLAAALNNPNSPEYAQIIQDIDLIAVQLRRLADAGVPVLWRPLHEAEGLWFWWGAKGPEPFKKLWRIMYDRLTHHHKLNNLIWVFTGDQSPEWYPGDDLVDIIGVDAYPSNPADALTSTWDELQTAYGGRKLVALTEIGGVPDIANARANGVYWSYFVTWSGSLGPRRHEPQVLNRLFNQPGVTNLKPPQ